MCAIKSNDNYHKLNAFRFVIVNMENLFLSFFKIEHFYLRWYAF